MRLARRRNRLRLRDAEWECMSTPPRIDRTVDANSFRRNTCWVDSPPRPTASPGGHFANDRGMCEGISVISPGQFIRDTTVWSRAIFLLSILPRGVRNYYPFFFNSSSCNIVSDPWYKFSIESDELKCYLFIEKRKIIRLKPKLC